jgi:hypothetical protein
MFRRKRPVNYCISILWEEGLKYENSDDKKLEVRQDILSSMKATTTRPSPLLSHNIGLRWASQ